MANDSPTRAGYRVVFFSGLNGGLKDPITANQILDFRNRSQISAPSHTFEFVGSGTNYDAIISDVGTLVNGRYFVNFSQLMSGAGAWNSSYGAVNRVLLGLKTSADVVNGSISGTMGEFGVIPAPGTIALLAVAGVFGSRRRR